jgi:methyl-accepting chemotaxis protein
MQRTDQLPRAWKTVFAGRSLDSRIRLVPRAGVVLVALFFSIAMVGQSIASGRLAALQRDDYPALRETRELATLLGSAQAELDATSRDGSGLGRADSLAARFHAISRLSQPAGVSAIDRAFGSYYLSARRAALGTAGSDDATVAGDAEVRAMYRQLQARLLADITAGEQHVASTLASAASLQSLVSWTLALCGMVAALLLALLGLAATVSISGSIDEITRTVDTLVAGELGTRISDTERGSLGRLNASLRRLARQMRDNSATAHALAAGDYRSATRTREPADPIGLALSQLSSSMEAIAMVAQRVSRGDLGGEVTPQGLDDAFGHAQAAMHRRVGAAFSDMEATRHSIASLVEQMRGDALALATATGEDADRLRRTVDHLAVVTLQARAQAARGDVLAERTSENALMLQQGTSAFEASQEMLREVVRKSAVVQRLARDAARLAVRSTSAEAADLQEGARALAGQAAATTSEIIRVVVEGTEHGHTAGVAIDRVAIALQDGTALVREVSASTASQSRALVAIDEAIVQVHGTTSRSADMARQLSSRLDTLASQARRLDALLRRFRRTPSTWGTPALIEELAVTGPVLYRTPPHAQSAFPKLAMAGR